jgi:NAD(P)-dependent dehydrogenase (short-subunit alcohol dehydrogenase family)
MKKVRELADLSGRVSVITGGAGHIGSAMAAALAEFGSDIVIIDMNQKACDDQIQRLKKEYSVEVISHCIDLTDEETLKSVPGQIVGKMDTLDILINCAALVGTTPLKGWVTPFSEQSADTWRSALEINLTVPFILTQACAEELKKSGNGSVINLGSLYGILGPDLRIYQSTEMGNPAAYAASKGGLLQLTRWMATVLAPDIRVNSISPGGIFRNQPQSFVEAFTSRTPLRRMGTEEDLKGATLFLASDLSKYITGQNLVVDGGWTVW